jgi:biotin carboxylase
MGYETHVFAWEEGAVAKETAHFFYPISIIKKNQILNYVKKINPIAICSVGSDLAVPTVNYIANKLGLIANTLKCAKITTNKFEMIKILLRNNLPCPKYQIIKCFDEINFNKITYPLIIKPIDRSGSRGVCKVDNIDSTIEAIKNAQKASFVDEVLIEEFIDGKEFSIKGISRNGKHTFLQITEKFTNGAPNFIEKGHLSPARLSDDKKQFILEMIEKSLDVLKIQNGASHSEIIISLSGDIKIIEIASRMGGDYIGSDMVYISTGFDFLKNVILIATGKDIDFKFLSNQKTQATAFVGFIFNNQDKEKFEKLKKIYPLIVKEYHIKEQMNLTTDSSSRNGYFILKIKNKSFLLNVLRILNIEK